MTTKVIQNIEVPSSVLDLVNARVASLSEEDRDLLDMACCLGFEFDPVLVAESTGTRRIPALKRLAQIERQHRLVRAAGSAYFFDHHQVQEALYRSLAAPLRKEYHAEIGKALKARDRSPEGSSAVDLCEHFLKGGQGTEALPHLGGALEHLQQGFMNEQVLRLADLALSQDGLLVDDERAAILNRKAAVLTLLGRPEECRTVIDEAIRCAREPATRREAQIGLAGSLLRTGDLGESEALLLKLANEASGDGGSEGKVTVLSWLASCLMHQGRLEEARELCEQVVAKRREEGDVRQESVNLGNLALILQRLGRVGEAIESLESAMRLARERSYLASEGSATCILGNVLLQQGRIDEAAVHYERYRQIGQECGSRLAEMNSSGNMSMVEVFGARQK